MKVRIYILIALGVGIAILQFSKNIFLEPNPIANMESPSTNKVSFIVSDLKPMDAKYIYLVNAANTSVMKSEINRKTNIYFYRLNLTDGKIQALNYIKQELNGKVYCLPKTLLKNIIDTFQSARICDSSTVETQVGNIYCAVEYTLPYAILIYTNGRQVKFGEKNTACDFPANLCGSDNQAFYDLAKYILAQIDKMKCQK